MVVWVEGIVNGDPVVFKRVVGDQWEAQVPSSLNGIYIIEMKAYDDAGNMAYTARYLLAYDPANLCVKLVLIPYTAELQPENWEASVKLSGFYAELVEPVCYGGG